MSSFLFDAIDTLRNDIPQRKKKGLPLYNHIRNNMDMLRIDFS